MAIRTDLAAKAIKRMMLPLALLGMLSACANPAAGPTAGTNGNWEHVHEGFLIGNIYTGDDHI